MIQKKWLFSLLLVILAQLTAQAQIDWGWSWNDSAVIANKKMPQRAEFLANEFPYPPKPRSMWEIGISLGNSRIIGDVANFTCNISNCRDSSMRERVSIAYFVAPNYDAILDLPLNNRTENEDCLEENRDIDRSAREKYNLTDCDTDTCVVKEGNDINSCELEKQPTFVWKSNVCRVPITENPISYSIWRKNRIQKALKKLK